MNLKASWIQPHSLTTPRQPVWLGLGCLTVSCSTWPYSNKRTENTVLLTGLTQNGPWMQEIWITCVNIFCVQNLISINIHVYFLRKMWYMYICETHRLLVTRWLGVVRGANWLNARPCLGTAAHGRNHVYIYIYIYTWKLMDICGGLVTRGPG